MVLAVGIKPNIIAFYECSQASQPNRFVVVARKAAADEKAAFATVCNALLAGGAPLLSNQAAYAELGYGGELEEFALRLCDTLGEFGGAHLEVGALIFIIISGIDGLRY
eukprot:scaffold286146_cov29-Prasinocladus_malaysianus.AAC.1